MFFQVRVRQNDRVLSNSSSQPWCQCISLPRMLLVSRLGHVLYEAYCFNVAGPDKAVERGVQGLPLVPGPEFLGGPEF